VSGTLEAGAILSRGESARILGARSATGLGQRSDVATLQGFGYSPAVTVILMGYLPRASEASSAAGASSGTNRGSGTPVCSVLRSRSRRRRMSRYRVICLATPLVGGVAFWSLRQGD